MGFRPCQTPLPTLASQTGQIGGGSTTLTTLSRSTHTLTLIRRVTVHLHRGACTRLQRVEIVPTPCVAECALLLTLYGTTCFNPEQVKCCLLQGLLLGHMLCHMLGHMPLHDETIPGDVMLLPFNVSCNGVKCERGSTRHRHTVCK